MLFEGVANGKIRDSPRRRDAETLVRNPSPRLFGKKFRDSKKVKTNHAKTRLRDLSKTLPRFRDHVKIFRDPCFSRYHSPPLFERDKNCDKSHLCACMIPNWPFESPVALASAVLPLLPRTHLNPSTCALTMQSCHYRKTTKEAFLFVAQPMTWHCTGHLPLQRNKVPSKNYPETDRFLEFRTHLMKNRKKIPAKREKDWTGTRSSPHTLQVQNGGPANLM